MSRESDAETRSVVDWGAGERRRRRLEAELERIVAQLPGLGVRRVILFGSLARGGVRGASDVDLILIADSGEPFVERGARFYRALVPAVAMDLLVYTPEEFDAMRDRPFFRRALAEGRVLYEA
jgi:predicted nucleotidyltransferase